MTRKQETRPPIDILDAIDHADQMDDLVQHDVEIVSGQGRTTTSNMHKKHVRALDRD